MSPALATTMSNAPIRDSASSKRRVTSPARDRSARTATASPPESVIVFTTSRAAASFAT
jgi:hypothetical protein